MLPTRAYADVPRLSPDSSRVQSGTRGTFVVAAAAADVDRFTSANFTRHAVHSTAEALHLIETTRPRVVIVDWDVPGIDGPVVCKAALKFTQTAILVTMTAPEHAPAALKAGCHAILLKPFAPNLVAARIGRLARELPTGPFAARAGEPMPHSGTTRVWPGTPCPHCHASSATGFEFSSYRRMWYACLQCDHVWLGARQE